MGTFADLQAFLSLFRNERWPEKEPARAKAFMQFARGFSKNVGPALDYLNGLGQAERAQALGAIRTLLDNNQWGWSSAIKGFKNLVDWEGTTSESLENTPYTTLPTLLRELQARLGTATATAREAYAVLLERLLPIYFVKAANIREMVDELLGMEPGSDNPLVVQASGPMRDYPPAETPARVGASTPQYDSGRGFLPQSVNDNHYLALTYNPNAMIEDRALLDAQDQRLEELRRRFAPPPAPAPAPAAPAAQGDGNASSTLLSRSSRPSFNRTPTPSRSRALSSASSRSPSPTRTRGRSNSR